MEQEDLVLSNAPADLFESAGHSLARQFLEGVRFLHRHLVAHLDLKPDNTVVSARTRLRIIDFSVAVRVPRLESRIKGYQGTKGWVAPEVERNPGAEYHPILADLWATGKMMRYFASRQPAHCSEMEALADQLQSPEPQQRPLLSTVRLDTPFRPRPRYQANSLKPKRKLDVNTRGKEEVKRQCVQLGSHLVHPRAV
jgi:serine/threonine protein kinase